MIKQYWFIGLLSLTSFTLFGQDSIPIASEKKWEISIDILSRYIWRGQSWGGNYPVIQPTIKYSISKKIQVGIWGTTNFKKEYFYPNGDFYKGYHEVDLFLIYNVTNYFNIQAWDYYWPTVSTVEGVSNRYFNYGSNGVKTLDCSLNLDLKEKGIPFTFQCSTLVAGNDFRYDSQGEHPKQNFTTYLETSYTFKEILSKKKKRKILETMELTPCVGLVLNNQAMYYTAGDYDHPSWVNLSLKLKKELTLSSHFKLPIQLNYIHNAATKNTDTFGQNFLVFSCGIYY